jgi:hypothetical protein
MNNTKTDFEPVQLNPYGTSSSIYSSTHISNTLPLPMISISKPKPAFSTELECRNTSTFYCASPRISLASSNPSLISQEILEDMISDCNDIKQSLPNIWTNLRKSARDNIQSLKSLKSAAKARSINALRTNSEYLTGKRKIEQLLKRRENPSHNENINFIQSLLSSTGSKSTKDEFQITHQDFQDSLKLQLIQKNRRMFGRKMSNDLNIETPRKKLAGNPKNKDIHIHTKNNDLLEDIYAYKREAEQALVKNSPKVSISPSKLQRNFYKEDDFFSKISKMDPLNKFISLERRKYLPKNISDLNRKKQIQTEARMMAIKASEQIQRKARQMDLYKKKLVGSSSDSSMDEISYRIRLEKLVGRK